jgi:hypothetical protein
MIRIGDRSFLFAWQMIRAATQPNAEATVWRVAGVRWCRHRYSHAAPDHAMTIEVHRLDHSEGKDTWSVMVVAEHWWDERHKLLRNTLWATHLSGSRMHVTEWFDRQARGLDKNRAGTAKQGTDADGWQHTDKL